MKKCAVSNLSVEIYSVSEFLLNESQIFGSNGFFGSTNGKVYDVMSVEKGWYRMVDDSGEDYLYLPEVFEIVKERSL